MNNARRVLYALLVSLLALVATPAVAAADDLDPAQWSGNLGMLLALASDDRGSEVAEVEQLLGDYVAPDPAGPVRPTFGYRVTDTSGTYLAFIAIDEATDDVLMMTKSDDGYRVWQADAQSSSGAPTLILLAAGPGEDCDAVVFGISQALYQTPQTAGAGAYVDLGGWFVCGFMKLIDSTGRQDFHAGATCTSAGIQWWGTSTDPAGVNNCSERHTGASPYQIVRDVDLRPVVCHAGNMLCSRPSWRLETLWPDGYFHTDGVSGSSRGTTTSTWTARAISLVRGRGYRLTAAAFESCSSTGGIACGYQFTGKIAKVLHVG